VQKKYTFRLLNSTDMFLMFKIIGKIGINEFAECFDRDGMASLMEHVSAEEENEGEEEQDSAAAVIGISVMLELANVIVKNLPSCEAEIYQLLANTSDLTQKQIKELDFVTFAEMIIDFIKKDEFRDFISVVSRLFK
jgi:hypothetical protein